MRSTILWLVVNAPQPWCRPRRGGLISVEQAAHHLHQPDAQLLHGGGAFGLGGPDTPARSIAPKISNRLWFRFSSEWLEMVNLVPVLLSVDASPIWTARKRHLHAGEGAGLLSTDQHASMEARRLL